MDYEENYKPFEMMIVQASRELPDHARVFLGVGLPVLATQLAFIIHAPHLIFVTQMGHVRTIPPYRPPVFLEGDAINALTDCSCGIIDTFGLAQNGWIEWGFLGGGQCDKYGNLNSTYGGGSYENPMIRWPGSGGACDVGCFCKRTIITLMQNRKRFPEKVDFITVPGYLDGPKARKRAGLPLGTGPYCVITQLGVYRFDEETKEMYLDSYHPRVRIDEIKKNTGWDLKVSPQIRETEPPTKKEIKALRNILAVDASNRIIWREIWGI